MKDPKSLGSALERLLSGLGAESNDMIELVERWPAVVGDSVASHSRPLKVAEGHLVVEVDDPRWATQMRFLESSIVSAASEVCGIVLHRVDVRVSRTGAGH